MGGDRKAVEKVSEEGDVLDGRSLGRSQHQPEGFCVLERNMCVWDEKPFFKRHADSDASQQPKFRLEGIFGILE